jgi:hypothetical protein
MVRHASSSSGFTIRADAGATAEEVEVMGKGTVGATVSLDRLWRTTTTAWSGGSTGTATAIPTSA